MTIILAGVIRCPPQHMDAFRPLVAAMVGAQWLFLMTDVEALFDADPSSAPGTAALLGSVYAAAHYIDEALLTVWRATPSSPASARVGGKRAPEGSDPVRIPCRNRSKTENCRVWSGANMGYATA